PFGVLVLDDERLAPLLARTGQGGPGLVQPLVVELDAGAAGPIAQDAGRHLPERPGLLGVGGFGKQPPNGIYHTYKLRHGTPSREYVARRRRGTAWTTVVRDDPYVTPFRDGSS